MNVTIDQSSRVRIPKKIRDQLGLRAGGVLRLEVQGHHLVLETTSNEPMPDEPMPDEPVLVRKGHVLIFYGGAWEGDEAARIVHPGEERTQELIQRLMGEDTL